MRHLTIKARYPRAMSSTNLPRHRASRTKALAKGFDSLRLDPSPRLRSLRIEISHRNTVAEAWTQTGQVLAEAMASTKKS